MTTNTPEQAIHIMLASIRMGNEPKHWDTDDTVAWFEAILAQVPQE